MKQGRIVEYIGDLSREMAQVSEENGLKSLAHLLRMAELEAHNIVAADRRKRPKRQGRQNAAA